MPTVPQSEIESATATGAAVGYRTSSASGPFTAGTEAVSSSQPAAARTAKARNRAMTRALRWAIFGGIGTLLIIGSFVLLEVTRTWVRYRPLVAALTDSTPDITAYMVRRASEGTPIAARAWVPLDSLPAAVVCAVVVSENANFFLQGALDWSNQRDLLSRLLRGDLSRGASGIPQQLARNLFLSPDRTVRRKLREYVLAFQVSALLTKHRQLELYLNMIEWGDGTWGVAAGSQALFGRTPDQLTPTESILLANVLPAPSRGLSFPLSPKRRAKTVRVAEMLWRTTAFDDITSSATAARIRRVSRLVDRGLRPDEALAAVANEMGPEPTVDPGLLFDPPARPIECLPDRRGVR